MCVCVLIYSIDARNHSTFVCNLNLEDKKEDNNNSICNSLNLVCIAILSVSLMLCVRVRMRMCLNVCMCVCVCECVCVCVNGKNQYLLPVSIAIE